MKLRRMLTMLLCIAMLLSLAACGQPRTAASADQFMAALADKGFEVEDVTKDYASEEYLKQVILAKKENSSIEFYIVESEKLAKDNVEYFTGDLRVLAVASAAEKTAKSANYSYYEQTSPGVYRLVSSIGETFIYIDAVTEDLANEAQAIAKTLGYAAK